MGLLGRGQEIPAEADALLAYAFGLSDDRPAVATLLLDPDRVRGFAARFLSRRGLCVRSLDAPPKPAGPPGLAPFAERFGAFSGLWYFSADCTLAEADAIHSTAFEARFQARDPSATVDGYGAARLLGMKAEKFSSLLNLGMVPKPDRKAGAFGRWGVPTLARWAGRGCPDAKCRQQPKLLAAIGCCSPAEADRPAPPALGMAAYADAITLPK